jgi:hypothetical protein
MLDETDCFPAFCQNINYTEYPRGFNPANLQNLQKYNGKQDRRQWLRIYSTAIEVAGGTNSTKVIYFPMALEPAPLTWLEGLKRDTIHSWNTCRRSSWTTFKAPSIILLLETTFGYAGKSVGKL